MIAEFFGLKRADISLPSSSASLGEIFGQLTTDSGLSVGPNKAMTYAPVWQAVSQISGAAAKLPLELMEAQGDDQFRLAVEHAAYQQVVEPSEEQMLGPFKFWRRHIVHALLWNRAYILIMPDGELLHLLPDRTRWDEENGIYVTEIDKQPRGFRREEIIELEGPQIENANTCKLVVKFRESVALGLAAQSHNAMFFKQGGFPGGVLEIPSTFSAKAADNLEIGWRKKYDTQGAGFRTAILRDGAKFHSVMVNAEASQMHELRTDQVYEVARWFNLSPSRLGLPDPASYNSKAEDNRSFFEITLSPWLCALTDELNQKLLTRDERTRFHFRHNPRDLLRLDPKLHAERSKLELEMGAITPNDYRISVGMNPREGGDFYLTPMNFRITAADGEMMIVEPPRLEGPPEIEPDEETEGTEGIEETKQPTEEESRGITYLESQVGLQLDGFVARYVRECKRLSLDQFVEWCDGGGIGRIDKHIDGLQAAIGAIAPHKQDEFSQQIRQHFTEVHRHFVEGPTITQVKETADIYRNGTFRFEV